MNGAQIISYGFVHFTMSVPPFAHRFALSRQLSFGRYVVNLHVKVHESGTLNKHISTDLFCLR